ncbi:hypothetical protein [Micrococcus porci]|uniref:hypothetical protein n=1 Tax=Micrococcus porci TaxID=2856555 RepID=UPI003CF31174
MSPRRTPVPAGERPAGERVGVVVAVTFPGADDATVFRAALADDLPAPGRPEPQEVLHLVWHGRHRVAGVMPGAWMRVLGHPVAVAGEPTLFNPEFHLIDDEGGPA